MQIGLVHWVIEDLLEDLIFVGGNLITWLTKKQFMVARSSANVEYKAMAHTCSELI